MHDTDDSIAVSLDDVAVRRRAIIGQRNEIPRAEAVAVTGGPAGGASGEFRTALGRAMRQASALTSALTVQLGDLEGALEATARELVAADEAVADDVGALTWMLGTVADPGAPVADAPVTTDGASRVTLG